VARHIFQASPVWIYTQSNITQASYSPEYITPTQQISWQFCYFSIYNVIFCRKLWALNPDSQKEKAFSSSAVQDRCGLHTSFWEIHIQFSASFCLTGLAELALKKYKSAAKHFLLAQFDHFEYKEVIRQT
jgi:hypothetical protein